MNIYLPKVKDNSHLGNSIVKNKKDNLIARYKNNLSLSIDTTLFFVNTPEKVHKNQSKILCTLYTYIRVDNTPLFVYTCLIKLINIFKGGNHYENNNKDIRSKG